MGNVFVTPTQSGLTHIRLRGELLLYLATSDALLSGFAGAFGIGIASTAAMTVGVASVPTPIQEEDSDSWLFHRYFHLKTPGAISAAGAALSWSGNGDSVLRLEVDTKAMRKLADLDIGLYCAIEVTEVGTASMVWQFNSRSLVKLP